MASRTTVIFPILKCLDEGRRYLTTDAPWSAVNAEQGKLLALAESSGYRHMDGLPELIAKASPSVPEINAYLAQNGFPDLRLEDNLGPNGFAVAAVLKVLVEWLQEGRRTRIFENRGVASGTRGAGNGIAYDAVHLGKDAGATFHRTSDGIIARIPTKSGDTICMMMYETDAAGLDLETLVSNIRIDTKSRDLGYEGVVFPMVDLDERTNLDFLVGMRIQPDHSDPYEIQQAIQQSRLKMDHRGAKMESAVAIGTRMITSVRPPAPQPFVIDRPFLFWAERRGMTEPYFIAYVAQDAWKDPGNIS